MTLLPLVMLPGLLLDRRLFAAQIDRLGHKNPLMIPDLTRDDSIKAMAQRVLDEAPPRFALCGLSMGGYVALEIMRQAPKRVAKLALLDTQARPESDEARERRTALIELAQAGDFAAAPSRLLPLLIHSRRLGDRNLVGRIETMAHDIGANAFVRQQRAIMSRPDSRATLAGITCSSLVLLGRDDALTPLEVHEEMARAMPRATLVVLPDCGHLSPMEQPDAVTGQLELWLKSEAEDLEVVGA